jgi:2-haloacid dehalogenase
MGTDRLAALVFDAYGTLYDVTSVGATCEARFPGHGRALTELWRQKQLEYSWLVALMGRYQDFWSLTEAALRHSCRALGLTVQDAAVRELLDGYLRLKPYGEVPLVLERLAARIPLAILSNGSPQMLLGVTRHNRLEGYFQHVLSADEVRVYKPSPRVYQLAIDRLGQAAGRIGFVSSNAWDALGAKACGLDVSWINRFHRPAETLLPAPDREIGTLEGLLEMV